MKIINIIIIDNDLVLIENVMVVNWGNGKELHYDEYYIAERGQKKLMACENIEI